MYELFYDEVTGQFFVANECEVSVKLKLLEKKYSFSLNEYCRALGIPDEDPFDTCMYYCFEFDPDSVFYMVKGMVYNIPAYKVGIWNGFV